MTVSSRSPAPTGPSTAIRLRPPTRNRLTGGPVPLATPWSMEVFGKPRDEKLVPARRALPTTGPTVPGEFTTLVDGDGITEPVIRLLKMGGNEPFNSFYSVHTYRSSGGQPLTSE